MKPYMIIEVRLQRAERLEMPLLKDEAARFLEKRGIRFGLSGTLSFHDDPATGEMVYRQDVPWSESNAVRL